MWRPITDEPTEPVAVVMYDPALEWYYADGSVAHTPRDHTDSRKFLAYWDGKAWFHQDTNHEVFERGHDTYMYQPTHYMTIPPPPRAVHGGSHVPPDPERNGNR